MKSQQSYAEKRKEQITIAAVSAFSKKGYTETTMKDIMNVANVSRGGLYAHFENIEAVFLEVLRYTDQHDLLPIVAIVEDVEVLTQFKHWLSYLVNNEHHQESNLVRAKTEFFLSRKVEATPYLEKRRNNVIESMTTFLGEGVVRGEFTLSIKPNELAETLLDMLDGILMRTYYGTKKDLPTDKKLEVLIAMLQNYIIGG